MTSDSPAWLNDKSVTLLPYNPAWASNYEEEAEKLFALLGNETVNIHHVGSTSIEGMIAKPLIDILIEVKQQDKIIEVETKLQSIGYIKKVFASHPEPLLMMGKDDKRTFNVHLASEGSIFAKSLLHFRDTLRKNKALMQEYIDLKSTLSQKYSDDRQAYYYAKEAFMSRIAPRI
jgi:GrpB-like predicted nucleotidyltransferase (UPF0157 family)